VSALYPRLVGAGWSQLPQVVQDVHSGQAEVHATGRFVIRGGTNVVARTLARLVGLPGRGEVSMELRVRPDAHGETWSRRFGERPVVTRQWEEDGLLVEERGPLQFLFSLTVAEGTLHFRQVAARLVRGRLCVPLHRWLAPVVRARAWAADGACVEVEIRAPAAGLLCAYRGVLRKEPA
jgi:hypothetical protein